MPLLPVGRPRTTIRIMDPAQAGQIDGTWKDCRSVAQVGTTGLPP